MGTLQAHLQLSIVRGACGLAQRGKFQGSEGFHPSNNRDFGFRRPVLFWQLAAALAFGRRTDLSGSWSARPWV